MHTGCIQDNYSEIGINKVSSEASNPVSATNVEHDHQPGCYLLSAQRATAMDNGVMLYLELVVETKQEGRPVLLKALGD